MTFDSPPAIRKGETRLIESQTFESHAFEAHAFESEGAEHHTSSSVSDRLRALAPEAPKGWVWTWDKRSLGALAAILAILIAVVGWWALSGPSVTEVESDSAFEPGVTWAADGVDGPPGAVSVVVHVAGEVNSPGVFTMPAGSRVHEVIEKAGGATKSKYLDGVNLARVLQDGEQIVVGESSDTNSGISLNSATETELDALTGIGPALAARIVEWRTANGPFNSVDQLEEVAGIGPSLVASLRDQVRL